MFKLGRKILILALLLVMPLQGIAASASHLLCMSADSGHHHDDNAAREHSHGSSNDDGYNDHTEHLSCHQVASGIPSSMALVFANSLPVYQSSGFSSPLLFFPEQPQRPPRA